MPRMSSCGSITHITTDGLVNKITPTGYASVFLLQWRSRGEGVGEGAIIVCIEICMLALIISGPCLSSIVTELRPTPYKGITKIKLGVIVHKARLF